MNQWTLPSQGLLSQNVESVFDVLRSLGMLAHPEVLPACSCHLPAWLNAGARVLSRYCT